MIWEQVWKEALGLSPSSPQWIALVLGLFLIYAIVIIPSGLIYGFLDRKLGADFQARVGPNRAGPAGIFQGVADLLKLLQKTATLRRNRTTGERLWLTVYTVALYSTVASLPLGTYALLMNTDLSVFFPFWAVLVVNLSVLFLGESQRTPVGGVSGMRTAAQCLSGAFPALISLLAAGTRAGGFGWSMIANAQGAWPFQWTAFANPFQFLSFLIFLVSGLVMLGLPPMSGAQSMLELHGGVASQLDGVRLSLFRFGRFYGLFLWAILTAVLFLGGWSIPAALSHALTESGALLPLQVLELTCLLSKTFLVILAVIWVSRVKPRSRVDQVTDFAVKILSPLALLSLVGAALFSGWGALS